MIGRKIKYLLIGLISIAATSVFGATITASVDRNDVGVGEQIVLSISISGKGGSLPDPTLPDLSPFEVYSSGRSQNISIGMGGYVSSVEINYVLVPKKAGDFMIGPVTVKDNGGIVSTQPIKITVRQQNQNAIPQQKSSQGAKSQPARKGDDFFMEQSVDKTNPYIGEQVVISARFYQGVNLWNAPQWVLPKYNGSIAEDLPPVPRYYVNINGRRYLVTEYKRAIFPILSGQLTIDSPQLTIRPDDFGANMDPFSFFNQNMRDLFKRGQPKLITAPPITLRIRQLPEAGKPIDFAGAVGKFKINVEADKDSVGVDEPITLKFTLAGTGNIKSISTIKLPELPDFRVYESGNTESISNTSGVISGTKTFEQAVIPKTSGKFILPSVKFSYFDPGVGAYKTVQTQSLNVVASGQGLSDVGGAPKNIIGTAQKSFGYIITDFSRPSSRLELAGSFWFWILQILPLGGIVAAFIYKSHYRKLLTDKNYARKINAGRNLKILFKKAETSKTNSQFAEFYENINDAILGFVADRLGFEKSGLTIDSLKSEDRIDIALRNNLTSFLEICQTARFSPQGFSAMRTGGILNDAQNLISRLEKSL